MKLLSARDEEETAADGDQIFKQGQHQIGSHRGKRAAVIVTGEGTRYPAHCTQQRAKQWRYGGGNTQGCTAHRAKDDPDSKRPGLRAGRG